MYLVQAFCVFLNPAPTHEHFHLFIINYPFLQDHLQEVLDKWDSIDDEIWAKIVVLERNRRVAKAYARAPVLTVNGTEQGFDGFRIGLSGFENPMRDIGTEEALRQINQVGLELLYSFYLEFCILL